MKFSYKYKFEKECLEINQDDLLNAFEYNLQRTECYHKITRKENRLDLDNDIFDFHYLYKWVYPWNLWWGIGKMNISISTNLYDESYRIEFSISFLRILFFYTINMIILCILLMTSYTSELFYFFILFNIGSVVSYFITYLRHKRFFYRTIEIGEIYKNQVDKSYDWVSILKEKADSELNEIINRNTHLPDIVIELAEKEMRNRNNWK